MFGLFNFWIPLILIIQIYYLLPKRNLRNLCLLASSYGFYISVDSRVFPFLLISTLTDYIAGFLVQPSNKKIFRFTGLFLSLFINLSLLFSFKYIPNFFPDSASGFTSFFSNIGLPLGISFYTFQTIGYTIDCYRGQIKPTSNLLAFALYVSFFPQIAAGPIERAKKLLPQFQSSIIKNNLQNFKEGFYLTLLGLFKKIYIADAISFPLNRIFNLEETSPSLALFAGFLAVLHLYTDFSAYSDLARGIAKFFGIDLIVNFKPFIFSKNPVEFYRNWHISLYKWIIRYPMRYIVKLIKTKRHSFNSLYIIVFMLIFSFWHKISINMFLNGLFNGFTIVAYYYLNKKNVNNLFPKPFRHLSIFIFMFLYYTIKGLFYYSQDFDHLIGMILKIFDFQGFGRETVDLLFYLFPFCAPLFIYEWFQKKWGTALFILKAPLLVRACWCAFVFACVFIFERGTGADFIYFGF